LNLIGRKKELQRIIQRIHTNKRRNEKSLHIAKGKIIFVFTVFTFSMNLSEKWNTIRVIWTNLLHIVIIFQRKIMVHCTLFFSEKERVWFSIVWSKLWEYWLRRVNGKQMFSIENNMSQHDHHTRLLNFIKCFLN
jgi:hypothetical protein